MGQVPQAICALYRRATMPIQSEPVERCLACEAVVNRETSSHPVLADAALCCLAIGIGGRRVLTRSASDPSPQLNRRDTERRQTERPLKR
jgi:hypothetical protein